MLTEYTDSVAIWQRYRSYDLLSIRMLMGTVLMGIAVLTRFTFKRRWEEEKLNLDDSQWEDIHVVTGALKMFFRELPEPLFPYCFFEQFVKAISQNYRLLFTKIRYSSSTFSSAGPVWTSCQIPGSFLARTTHSQVSQ
ncbi:rho GTPase-activating protein 15 isoform X2 [Paroedura picta]|uniref:rho GTPase-activating protein 15 isoform X2 n=1 Tax=Paroedura picta TaxID=143630 RepID=UPI004056D07D